MVIGPLQFDSPWWLLLALIGAGLAIWIAQGRLTGLGPISRHVATGLRVIALVLAAAALAEPSYRLTSKGLTVIVVSDQSRSVPPQVHDLFRDYLRKAVAEAPADARLAWVTAAQDPRAHVLPSKAVSPGDLFEAELSRRAFDAGPTEATNLEQAIRLALAIKPEDTAARILLVSDGNETDGSLLAAAESLRSAGVPLDTLAIPYDIDREIIFDGLIAPATARMGQTVNVRFAITSTRPTQARLGLRINGEPFDLTPGEDGLSTLIDLDQGNNVVSVPVQLAGSRYQRFEADIEPLDPTSDVRLQNNTASAVTFVSSEGRILIYADDPRVAAPLQEALSQARLDSTVVSPAEGPKSLGELQDYDAIVLFDVPSSAFSLRQQRELVSHVHDAGAGLVMIGGPNAFGAGGWIGTPVAEVLPLRMDPPQKRQIPRGALALIMHSCEIPEGNFWGQKTAEAAAARLSRLDLVGVAEYDFRLGSRWVYPLSEKGDGSGVQSAINRLTFGDMPDFNSAMSLVVNALAQAAAAAKHCIIISDGDPVGPSPELLQQFIDNKISISTVCVFPHGGAGDVQKMRNLAIATGGNPYLINTADALATLPDIFIKEAQIVKRPLIWEGDPVVPQIVNRAAEPMRGISGPLPAVSGYIITAERDGLSLVTVKGPEEDPIVAQWQHGLGRSVAFTSDTTSRWSSAWLNWGQFRAFWEQHLRWVMRPSGSANVSIATISRGESTRVIVTALDTSGDPLNFARFQGRVSRPDDQGQQLDLRQTGPGRYEGEFPTSDAGSYLISVRYDAPRAGADTSQGPQLESGTSLAAVSRPFADEYRALKDNAALLRQVAELSGGRVLNPDPGQAQVFDSTGLQMPVAATPIWLPLTLLSLGFFLSDVAVRRVRIDIPAMARALRKLASPSARAEARKLEGLKAVRESARARFGDQPSPTESAFSSFGEQPATVARAKFEASTEELRGAPRSPLDTPGSMPQTSGTSPASPQTPTGDRTEEGGISRLKRAKQRAQDTYKEEDPQQPG